jgi:membrane protease YdiL (CAAX protease family)
MADAVRTSSRTTSSPAWDGRLLAAGALAATVVGCLGFALLNGAWFDVANGIVGLRDPIARAALFSAFPLVVGIAVVIRDPASFGLRIGDVGRHWRLIVGLTAAACAATAGLLALIGGTPYSDAALLVESGFVPVTEELIFRSVLLTALLAASAKFAAPGWIVTTAVVINGIGFGAGHLANAGSIDPVFAVGQAVFAAALGMACALLMVRTRSVYPAMLLHAAVNAVVVLI